MSPGRAFSVALLAFGAAAPADVIYHTNDPYFGPNGPPSFSLSDEQAVALRFTPARDYTLDAVRMWIVSDNFDEVSHATVRVQVRDTGSDVERPGPRVLEEMQFNVSALGWDPVLESVESQLHPMLRAGQPYWIVLSCQLHNLNPGWNWSNGSHGFVALSYGGTVNFNTGGEGAVTATTIEGTLACHANCDRSTVVPILNVNDFQCFLNAFATGDPLANCDSSSVPPALNINDFQCFLNAFAAGCS
jgi:hypothetical protein